MRLTPQNVFTVVCGLVLVAMLSAILYDKLTIITSREPLGPPESDNSRVVINHTKTIAPRKLELFNKVHDLREALAGVGIGRMRKWWNDDFGWMSSSGFYEFGDPGPTGLATNLAIYLESPSQSCVTSLKLKVNINNMADKEQALKRYTSAVEKTFNIIHVPMPLELKHSLLSGRPYEMSTDKYTLKNIFEPGRIDSWKMQIIAK